MRGLSELIGRWRGTGSGRYPTIDDFEYREELTVVATAEPGILRYIQETRRMVENGDVPSHIETGFIDVSQDDRVIILNAQGADRVEVLVGTVDRASGETVIRLESNAIAHDDRMVGSWRNITIRGHRLDYEMGMTTVAVPGGANHLVASLERVAPAGAASGTDHDEIGT